jgi:hypothetical protein
MKKVFISLYGTVSFTPNATTVATALMHCNKPRKYAEAAEIATMNAKSVSDIEKMDFDWMNRCIQSVAGGNVFWYFSNVKPIALSHS